MKSHLNFYFFSGIPRTKKNKKTISKAIQSLWKQSVFSQVLLRFMLSDEDPALCPPPCPQIYSTKKSKYLPQNQSQPRLMSHGKQVLQTVRAGSFWEITPADFSFFFLSPSDEQMSAS